MLLPGQRRKPGDRRECNAVPLYQWKESLGRQSSRTKEAHLDGEEVPKHDIPCSKASDSNQVRIRDGQERESLAFEYFR